MAQNDSAPAVELIGRGELITSLSAAAEQFAGSAGLIDLVGDAGVGKSSILDACCDRWARDGAQVAEGRGYRRERDLGFGVLATLVDRLRGFPNMDPTSGSKLSALALDLATAGTPGNPVNVLAVGRSLLTALAGLSSRSPVVLAIDDLHWVDEASTSVLAFLLRHGADLPLLVVSARRPGVGTGPLLTMDESDQVLTVDVPVLLPAEAKELLSSLPDDVQQAVLIAAGGNPFFLRTLAAAAARGDLSINTDESGPGSHGVPAPVRAALVAELRELPSGAAKLVRAASVLGDPFAIAVAAGVAGRIVDDATADMDILISRRLITPLSDGRSYAFRHPLVGAAILDSIPPGARILAHRAAAQVLEEQGADLITIARHIEASADIGDMAAFDTLLSAGTVALPLTPRVALRFLRAAEALLPRDAVTQHATVTLQEAEALNRLGRMDAAGDLLTKALDELPATEVTHRALVTVGLGRLARWEGKSNLAIRRLWQAISDLPEDHPAERSVLYGLLALAAGDQADREGLQRLAPAALAEARRAGAMAEFGVAACLGYAEMQCGEVALARDRLQQAQHWREQLSRAEVAAAHEGLILVSATQYSLGLNTEASQTAAEGLDLALSAGATVAEFRFRMQSEICATTMGDLTAARHQASLVEELAHQSADCSNVALALTRQCDLALICDEPEQAMAAGEAALSVIESCLTPVAGPLCVSMIARVWMDLGQGDRARRLLLAQAGGEELTRLGWPQRGGAFETLTRSALTLGDLEGAARSADRLTELAEHSSLPRDAAAALRARARLLATRGDSAAADAALEAMQILGSTEFALLAARTRLLAGHVLLRLDRKAEAKELLEQAASTLADFGAGHYAAQAHALLGDGLSTAATSRRRPSGEPLTTRETEIAALAAEGCTSVEIADLLHLSRRTVESHLAASYRKLGIRSRNHLAIALARYRTLRQARLDGTEPGEVRQF